MFLRKASGKFLRKEEVSEQIEIFVGNATETYSVILTAQAKGGAMVKSLRTAERDRGDTARGKHLSGARRNTAAGVFCGNTRPREMTIANFVREQREWLQN